MSNMKVFWIAVITGLVLVFIGMNTQPVSEPVMPTPSPTADLYQNLLPPLPFNCEQAFNEALVIADGRSELVELALTLYDQCLRENG